MFWYGGGWGFWQAALMWVLMIAFLALVAWAVWALVRAVTRNQGQQDGNGLDGRGRDARAILDERLARGEIDVDEYRRLREEIGADARR